MVGRIAKVVSDRGFGFIRESNNPNAKDTFFHAKDVMAPLFFEELTTGIRVEYELEENEKGIHASGVRLAD